MGLYKITAKRSGSWGGIRLEKGMSVEVSFVNPPLGYPQGKELVRQALLRKYGIDCKNLVSQSYFDVEKIN
ncbi:MAG: DUF6140 family protein [Bacillota bacterium]